MSVFVRVQLVHGQSESAEDERAEKRVADTAWRVGCRRISGTGDFTTYEIPADRAADLVAVIEEHGPAWWRIVVGLPS